jgi:hypothetical protein
MAQWLKSKAGDYLSEQTKANLITWKEKISEFTKDILAEDEDNDSDRNESLDKEVKIGETAERIRIGRIHKYHDESDEHKANARQNQATSAPVFFDNSITLHDQTVVSMRKAQEDVSKSEIISVTMVMCIFK